MNVQIEESWKKALQAEFENHISLRLLSVSIARKQRERSFFLRARIYSRHLN